MLKLTPTIVVSHAFFAHAFFLIYVLFKSFILQSKNFDYYTNIDLLEAIVHRCSQKACNFVKKRLRHRCFPLKFAKFLRALFFTEHLRWFLLFSLKQTSKNEKSIFT